MKGALPLAFRPPSPSLTHAKNHSQNRGTIEKDEQKRYAITLLYRVIPSILYVINAH